MGRPSKQGLEYFPLDVDDSEEIEMLEYEHGILGFAILIRLWRHIYKHGYFIKWNNKKSIVLAKRFGATHEKLNGVVETCLECELFDREKFDDMGIITSRGIQKRYFKAAKDAKRSNIQILEGSLIISLDKVGIKEDRTVLIPDNSGRNRATAELMQEETTPEPPSPVLSTSESTQSIVKESIVKESIVKKTTIPAPQVEDEEEVQESFLNILMFDDFWVEYPKKVGKQNSKKEWDKLKPDQTLIATMIQSVKNHKNSTRWTKEHGQYIPDPERWIKYARWEDAVEIEIKKVPYSDHTAQTVANLEAWANEN